METQTEYVTGRPSNTGDTHRQRQLQFGLEQAGIEEPWREWLLRKVRAGISHRRIANLIEKEFGFVIEGSTLGKWLEQIKLERQIVVKSSPRLYKTPSVE